MKEYITNSDQETIALGETFAKELKGGDIICLTGDLGGGKTHFTKGIAKGLGIEEDITSPTFVLMRDYETNKGFILHHLDLYRLKGAQALEGMDLDDYLGAEDSLVVIEWPENAKEAIPKNAIWIRFEYINDNTRKIIIEE